MFELFKKKEHEEQNDGEEKGEPLTVLQELEREENALLEKKRDLLNIEDELQLKIREEMEARKRRIEALNNEIAELRHQCEEFANVLNIPVRK